MQLQDLPAFTQVSVTELASRPRCGLTELPPHTTFHPCRSGATPGPPFIVAEATVRNRLNFTLDTALAYLDLRGEVDGGGNYEQLPAHTVEIEAFGLVCKCVTLEPLIQLKRAAGRT